MLKALVRHTALLWGLMLFTPVGMNYLGAVLLTAALLVGGDLATRYAQLRKHPLWWPAVVFTGWTLLVLALQPVYFPETPSNLFHGLRIILTLALALALTREEAVWALCGLGLAALASLAIIALHAIFGLPPWEVWMNLIQYNGNKSIANAALFALLAASAITVALAFPGRIRLVALIVAVAMLAVIVGVLPSRTSLLIVAVSVLGASLHRWRAQRIRLAASVTAAVLAFVLLVTIQPRLNQLFAKGLAEVALAQTGVADPESSWGIRFHMVLHTGQMMLEKPGLGWGIGSWNSQWKLRAPAVLEKFNMPHNDFLWMGAQAGIPGALALLVLIGAGIRQGWRRKDLTGQLGLVACITLLITASVNSALRDAAIGLSLLWPVGVCLRLLDEPGEAWLVQPSIRMH